MTASAVRYLVQVGALAAVYVAAAKGGLLLATEGAQVTLVWPPTGLALAALLLGGPRLWPGVALAAGLSTIASATIGVTSLVLGGVLPLRHVATAWGTWWLGDALGDLVVA